jgi:UDP-glucose 4-epimerase
MTIVLAGATGFVAGRVAPRLVDRGELVVAAGHDPSRLPHQEGVECVAVDLREDASLRALPQRVDVVVQLAQANTSTDLQAVNVAGTRRLLEYARAAGARRFVLASSGSVYAPSQSPHRESDPVAAEGEYVATKVEAERLAHELREELDVWVIRIFTPYGPGQRGRLVPDLLERVRAGTAVILRGGGRPRLSPIYVDDVANIFVQAALDGTGSHVVNAGGEEPLTIRQAAEIIGSVVGRQPVFEESSDPPPPDIVADCSEMRRLFDLPSPLTRFGDGVRAMVAA